MCLHVTTSFVWKQLEIASTVFVFLVPGDPQDVKVMPINSTTIKVNWKPPLAKDRNGIIRGYHIHVQETKEEVFAM